MDTRDWGGQKDVGLVIKGNMRDPCGEGNILYLFFFINLFIFIFGCVGSSFLCEGFL